MDFLVIKKGKDGMITRSDIDIIASYDDCDVEKLKEELIEDENFVCMVPLEWIEEEVFSNAGSDDFYRQ